MAGGLFYGEGEEILTPIFQDAWRGLSSQVIVSPGANRLPLVHVRDMARLVRQVTLSAESINVLESPPYFLAIDQASATQQELIQCIVDEMGEHYDVQALELLCISSFILLILLMLACFACFLACIWLSDHCSGPSEALRGGQDEPI